jgi:5-hydroxyisourate hydrolase
MVSLSTHVLDTSIGRPAAGVAVRLQRHDASGWVDVSDTKTDADGRVQALVPAGAAADAGRYRLIFDVGAYFAARGQDSFYTQVTIDFTIGGSASHSHVPLLVSPYGYSTYRGS